MRRSLVLTTLAVSLTPASLLAQSTSDDTGRVNTLRGIRIEGNVGGEQFKSQNVTSDSRFGYGGTVGFDGLIGDRIVIGPEASYWQPNKRAQNCTAPTSTSLQCDREGRELGVALRAGFLVTPRLLVFGKGGYANASQSGTYSTSTGFYYLNGRLTGPGFSSYRSDHIGGYQFGGGVEYTVLRNVYVDAQYVYSHYNNNTLRQRVMGGVGIRFW